MSHGATRFALAASVALVVCAGPGAARATPIDAPDQPDRPEDKEVKPLFYRFALELNPFAFIVGRYSFNAELMTGTHAAIVVSPFFRYANASNGGSGSLGVATLDSQAGIMAGGTEVGVRYYSGSKGPNGFFIGPSIIVESVSQQTTGPSPFGVAPQTSTDTKIHLGFAADIGGQWVSDGGFIIGAAGGVTTAYDFPELRSDVFPRILFSIGQAL